MKSFIGLLKFEHRQLASIYMMLMGLVVLAITVLPHIFVYFKPHLTVPYARFSTIMLTAIGLIIVALYLFTYSLNKGREQKDVWLHTPTSIYVLVLVKLLYVIAGLVVLEACAFVGFFFVGELVEGSVLDFAVLALYCTIFVIGTFLFFITLVFVGYVLYIQMARYIKKASYLVVFLYIILFFNGMAKIPDITLFQYGYIDFSSLNHYIPTFLEEEYSLTLFFTELYIVEELVYITLFIVIYMLTCKWLERVLTR